MLMPSQNMQGEGRQLTRIAFNTSKCEKYHAKSTGYQNWCRHLRATHHLELLRDELSEASLKDVDVLVFGAPQDMFSIPEVDILKEFITDGGSVLILCDHCNEGMLSTVMNPFTEYFGITINGTHAICTSNRAPHHPKEGIVSRGTLNSTDTQSFDRTFDTVVSRIGKDALEVTRRKFDDGTVCALHSTQTPVIMPLATTLTVQKPATSVLSTGRIAYPMQHSLGAVWSEDSNRKGKTGRLAVLGSAGMAADDWLNCSGNAKFLDAIVSWLSTASSFPIHGLNTDVPDINESKFVSHIFGLAERTRCCLQEIEEPPKDFKVLFDGSLFHLRNVLGKEAVHLHFVLSLKYETLGLIDPKFFIPMVSLRPSVFLPSLREPNVPRIELFDLEDEFASEQFRLTTILKRTLNQTDSSLEAHLADSVNVCGMGVDNFKTEHFGSKLAFIQVFKHMVRLKSPSKVP